MVTGTGVPRRAAAMVTDSDTAACRGQTVGRWPGQEVNLKALPGVPPALDRSGARTRKLRLPAAA